VIQTVKKSPERILTGKTLTARCDTDSEEKSPDRILTGKTLTAGCDTDSEEKSRENLNW
jgi:hypothetical protein